jgi:hypothetical protein
MSTQPPQPFRRRPGRVAHRMKMFYRGMAVWLRTQCYRFDVSNCFISGIGLVGICLMFWADWKMALGVVLLMWSENLKHFWKKPLTGFRYGGSINTVDRAIGHGANQ